MNKQRHRWSIVLALLTMGFCSCGWFGGAREAVPLVAEPVAGDDGGIILPEETGETHELFDMQPGQWVPLKSCAGTVDPTGTSLENDFDGDGIENDMETATNAWVAEYPKIETSVAVPVTMKIEILQKGSTTTESVTSDITSADVSRNIDESMEDVHSNEMRLRTVQYQDSYNKSSSDSMSSSRSYSHSVNVSASLGFGGFSGGQSVGGSTSRSSSYSEEHARAYGETKTFWKTVPFKDNLDRQGTSINQNAASRNARAMRTETRKCTSGEYGFKENSGYIRASLTISNESVNMPVRLSNILCSLMFETPEGQLVPVQSFRLRNEDYSLFTIDLYGGETFGPYVIELKNLNTVEITDAIAKAYNPRVFIVNYEMTHTADSNYRQALSRSFTGDNLKIIEENAKGRTAGIRIVGRNMREFYRVCAFDTQGSNETRQGVASQSGLRVSPGVSLEKALNRAAFSGISFEYANFVFDFSGMVPEMKQTRYCVRGIYSVNGVRCRLPEGTRKITDGDNVTYVIPPAKEWSEEEANNLRLWVVFDKGRYYFHSADSIDAAGAKKFYDLDGRQIPMLDGIGSTIWPGDNYDIVCIDNAEYMAMQNAFGNNPIETGEVRRMYTRWNPQALGENPFDPEICSQYLGEALCGDTIEFRVRLCSTKFLDPRFGGLVSGPGGDYVNEFAYAWDMPAATKKFYIDEALDFEISFGFGGTSRDWLNLYPARSPASRYASCFMDANGAEQNISRSWDYLNQEFVVRMTLPAHIDGAGEDGLVKLFIRPALNNATRESMWPLPSNLNCSFAGRIVSAVEDGAKTRLVIDSATGAPVCGKRLQLLSNGEGLDISEVVPVDGDVLRWSIICDGALEGFAGGRMVAVCENTAPQKIAIFQSNDLANIWNSVLEYVSSPDSLFAPLWNAAGNAYSPGRHLGYALPDVIVNWLGNHSFSNPSVNNWSVASAGFLQKVFGPLVEQGGAMIAILDKATADFASRFSRVNVEGEGLAWPVIRSDDRYEVIMLFNYALNQNELWIRDITQSGDGLRKIVMNNTPNSESALIFDANLLVENGKTLVATLSSDRKRVKLVNIDNASASILREINVGYASGNETFYNPMLLRSTQGYVVIWSSSDKNLRLRIYNSGFEETMSCQFYEHDVIPEFTTGLVYNNTLLLGSVHDDSSITLQYIDCLTGSLISDSLVVGNTGSNPGPFFFSNAGEQSMLSFNKNGTWVSVVCSMDSSIVVKSAIYHDVEKTCSGLEDLLLSKPSVLVKNGIALVALPGSSSGVQGIHLRWIDLGDNRVVAKKNFSAQYSYKNSLAIHSIHFQDKVYFYWAEFDDSGHQASLNSMVGDFKGGVYTLPHRIACEEINPGMYWIMPRAARIGSFAAICWMGIIDTPSDIYFNTQTFHHLLSDSLTGNDVTEGQNRFFIAPLIERSYDVSAKIVK